MAIKAPADRCVSPPMPNIQCIPPPRSMLTAILTVFFSSVHRYVLFEAEDQGLSLPAACRMGCCTACAVKVKSGTITQPQALGLSAGLKAQGYALLCVGYAQSDLEVELQDPDEVYDLQFGQAFDQMATDPSSNSVMRDDYALELATGDE